MITILLIVCVIQFLLNLAFILYLYRIVNSLLNILVSHTNTLEAHNNQILKIIKLTGGQQ